MGKIFLLLRNHISIRETHPLEVNSQGSDTISHDLFNSVSCIIQKFYLYQLVISQLVISHSILYFIVINL